MTRPVGTLQPADSSVAKALSRIDRGDLAEAGKLARKLSADSTTARAWKELVSGRIAFEQGRLIEAETHFLRTACFASATVVVGEVPEGLAEQPGSRPVEATGPHAVENSASHAVEVAGAEPEGLRLMALGLHHAGRVCRRLERPVDAMTMHQAAYRLRDRGGSVEEMWETAVELGLDGEIAQDRPVAEQWLRTAIELAGQAHDASARRVAIAWDHLATVLERAGRAQEAVSAARAARDGWVAHDVGAVEAAAAEARLGAAMLAQAEHQLETDPETAPTALRAAIDVLAGAAAALDAFGPAAAGEAQACVDRIDVARRLLSSLEA